VCGALKLTLRQREFDFVPVKTLPGFVLHLGSLKRLQALDGTELAYYEEAEENRVEFLSDRLVQTLHK